MKNSASDGACARTWYVPTDYPTIQSAADAASPNDSVIVLPGVYGKPEGSLSQPVVTIDKALTLVSLDGAGNTVIDGVTSDPDSASLGIEVNAMLVTVSGFTCRNCYVGISASGFLITTFLNEYRSNHYGLLISGVGVHVERSTFEANAVGLACFSAGASGRIDHNVFVENGVGLTFLGGGELFVLQNTICFSESTGIVAGFSSPIIQNNIVYASGVNGLSVRDLFPVWNFFCNDVYGSGSMDYEGVNDQTGINGNISIDPVFCDEANFDFGLCLDSPLTLQTCGFLGAYGVTCGYCRTPIKRTTWGALKAIYR